MNGRYPELRKPIECRYGRSRPPPGPQSRATEPLRPPAPADNPIDSLISGILIRAYQGRVQLNL